MRRTYGLTLPEIVEGQCTSLEKASHPQAALHWYITHTHVRRLFRCYTQNTIALQRTIIEFALFTISKIFYSAQIFQTQIFLIFITKNTKGTAIYFNSGYKFVWLLLICLRFSILFTFLLIFHIGSPTHKSVFKQTQHKNY